MAKRKKTSKLYAYANGGFIGGPTLRAKPNLQELAPEPQGVGGQLRQFRGGGEVDGPGGPTDDKVGPVMLSDGEYVLPADTVEAVGVENLEQLRKATHTPKKLSLKSQLSDIKGQHKELSKLRESAQGMADGGLTSLPRYLVGEDSTGTLLNFDPETQTTEQRRNNAVFFAMQGQPIKKIAESVIMEGAKKLSPYRPDVDDLGKQYQLRQQLSAEDIADSARRMKANTAFTPGGAIYTDPASGRKFPLNADQILDMKRGIAKGQQQSFAQRVAPRAKQAFGSALRTTSNVLAPALAAGEYAARSPEERRAVLDEGRGLADTVGRGAAFVGSGATGGMASPEDIGAFIKDARGEVGEALGGPEYDFGQEMSAVPKEKRGLGRQGASLLRGFKDGGYVADQRRKKTEREIEARRTKTSGRGARVSTERAYESQKRMGRPTSELRDKLPGMADGGLHAPTSSAFREIDLSRFGPLRRKNKVTNRQLLDEGSPLDEAIDNSQLGQQLARERGSQEPAPPLATDPIGQTPRSPRVIPDAPAGGRDADVPTFTNEDALAAAKGGINTVPSTFFTGLDADGINREREARESALRFNQPRSRPDLRVIGSGAGEARQRLKEQGDIRLAQVRGDLNPRDRSALIQQAQDITQNQQRSSLRQDEALQADRLARPERDFDQALDRFTAESGRDLGLRELDLTRRGQDITARGQTLDAQIEAMKARAATDKEARELERQNRQDRTEAIDRQFAGREDLPQIHQFADRNESFFNKVATTPGEAASFAVLGMELQEIFDEGADDAGFLNVPIIRNAMEKSGEGPRSLKFLDAFRNPAVKGAGNTLQIAFGNFPGIGGAGYEIRDPATGDTSIIPVGDLTPEQERLIRRVQRFQAKTGQRQ